MFSLPTFLTSSPTPSLTYKTDIHNGLARLYTEPVPSIDHRYYASLVTHFTTSQHVFDIFSIKDVRLIRERQPDNLSTLVKLLVRHLEALKVDEEFAPGEVAPMTGQSTRNRTREALNCARLLARILPVVMEAVEGQQVHNETTWTSPLEEDILWSCVRDASDDVFDSGGGATTATSNIAATPESEQQFVIDDEQEEQGSEEEETSGDVQQPPSSPPLLHRLLTLTLEYLFLPGFTLPTLAQEDEDDGSTSPTSRSRFVIWEKGVGSSQGIQGTTRTHVQHRIEFLRLLIVLLSKATYVPPPSQERFHDRALQYVCTSLNRTMALPVLCSLLNTACAAGAESQWSAAAAFLPTTTSPTPQEKDTLRGLCFQVLVVLLQWNFNDNDGDGDGDVPALNRSLSTTSIHSTDAGSVTNTFTHWLSKIHRVADLSLLSTCLFDILKPGASGGSLFNLPFPPTPLGSTSNELHSSQNPEAMTLLWILLRSNAKFRQYVLSSGETSTETHAHTKGYTLLTLLLSHALLGKDTPSSHGLVRLSLFILQDISSNDAFAQSLSLPQSASHLSLLPSKYSHSSTAKTASDVVICTLYTLLTTKGTGSTGLGLHPVILLTLCNLSPYFINLSIPASTRLSLLLSQFSTAEYLLADEGNPRNVYFLLETLNCLLLENPDKNTNFVYALLGKQRDVQRLREFSLRVGVAEMRRRRGVVVGSGLGASTVSRERNGDEEASRSAQQEKQRLAAALDAPQDRDAGREDGEGPGSAGQEDVEGDEIAEHRHVVGDEATDKAAEVVDGQGENQITEAPDVVAGQGETQVTEAADIQGENQITEAAEVVADPTPSQKALGKSRRTSNDADTPAPTCDTWVNSLTPTELSHTASTLLNLTHTTWQPTEDWVNSWQPHLSLSTLEKLHKSLLPEMETLCTSEAVANKSDADVRVLAWLRSKHLREEVFGEIRQHSTREFKWTRQVSVWLASYIWGAIYVAHLSFNLWPQEGIRLFYLVQQQQQQQKKRQVDSTQMATQQQASLFSVAFGAVFGGQQGVQEQKRSAGSNEQDAHPSTSSNV